MQLTTPRSITRSLAVVMAIGAVAGSASVASAASTASPTPVKSDSARARLARDGAPALQLHNGLPVHAPAAGKKLKAKKRRALERRIRHRMEDRSASGANCLNVDDYGFVEWCYYADDYGIYEVDELYLGIWDYSSWVRGYGWLSFI